MLLDAKAPTTVLDKTSKVANDILKVHIITTFICFYCSSPEFPNLCVKHDLFFLLFIIQSMRRIAEESIPRSAENIALAVGALCMVNFTLLDS